MEGYRLSPPEGAQLVWSWQQPNKENGETWKENLGGEGKNRKENCGGGGFPVGDKTFVTAKKLKMKLKKNGKEVFSFAKKRMEEKEMEWRGGE